MPTLDELYPSKFLKAADLQGKECTVEIEKITIEEFEDRGGKKKKIVSHFKNATKAFVCNKTNARAIGKFCGHNTDEWPGNRVTLYPTVVDYAGDQVDTIRVKEPPRTVAKTDTPPPDDTPTSDGTSEPVDEIPF